MWNTVLQFSKTDTELARDTYQLGRDVQGWTVSKAQEDLLDSGPLREKVVQILYRPFDTRYTYYTGRSRGFMSRPGSSVMQQMLDGKNLALMMPKRVEHVGAWQHVFITATISDHVAVSLKTIDYHFPLYLHPSADRFNLFSNQERTEVKPNLNPKLVEDLTEAHGQVPSVEAIFYYVYAVLYTPAYQRKYAEFLRTGFPHIPFTSDQDLFEEFARNGTRLANLHLLKSSDLDPPVCRFEGKGDSVVAPTKSKGFRYDTDEQRMHINRDQCFAPISTAVHEYRIGGYQVCEKWLKDRKGRRLELDDIRTYCRMVTALNKTLEIQQELDDIYEDVEGNCVSFEIS